MATVYSMTMYSAINVKKVLNDSDILIIINIDMINVSKLPGVKKYSISSIQYNDETEGYYWKRSGDTEKIFCNVENDKWLWK